MLTYLPLIKRVSAWFGLKFCLSPDIRNCVREIQQRNKRYQMEGYYLNSEELRQVLETAYPMALDHASLEVAEGQYETAALERAIDKQEIINKALALISR